MGKTVFLVAAEPSGDLLASEIATSIRHKMPDISIKGIGGRHLERIGIVSPIDTSELSVVGLVEGLKIYKRVIELADQAADEIIKANPDVVGLVDSWGYTLRVAQRVRERAPDIPLVKVVGPQVWATRPGRAKTLAKVVDHLVCIHAFEAPFYEPFDLPVTVMGNPALSRGHVGSRVKGREAIGASDTDKVLLVLPGSRRGEIEHVAPELIAAARQAKNAIPDLKVIFSPSDDVAALFQDKFGSLTEWAEITSGDVDRFDVMAAADYAMACSGTVTSELALQSTPFLVGYHTGWITWALARFFLFKPTHITLLNIAADDTEVVPEFVQTKFKAADMAKVAVSMLNDESARDQQIAEQKKALDRMGEGDLHSATIAAATLLDYID
ncbi:MAG: lipid-A-disaccharide synthase [Pseudomonadota bacterium]|nr:lipid-A-disaccharide synthase [Pseudomonadota bacterium]